MANEDDAPTKITREDLEAKVREVVGGVERTQEQFKNTAVAAGSVLIVLLILLAFLAGRKRGAASSTVVEIRRI